ncbi:MAG: NAD-dependent malic enzyme [Chlamydiae bacterium]|nr:NAD-dependent malic enzyme [Chlamydiota bacterium]
MERNLSPMDILNDPLMNKGTAFTQQERDAFGLNGYLPYHISTIQEQLHRRYHNFLTQPDQLSKFQFLYSLQNRNEILFYRLILEHLSEMLPYIYTPTVGDVSLQYSTLYREHRGLYLTYPHKEKMKEILDSLPHKDIDVIVVTDGERVLGLGDVGVGGMTIPVGKLSLYTLLGGIHPAKTLPIFLDVGTNNPDLLRDEHYLGWRNERITGSEYDAFVDQFVQLIKERFPGVLLQWEDFAKAHAKPLLTRYQDQLLSFNDDIQGTAAVVLAAVISAIHVSREDLKDQQFVVLGGGSAGLGICSKILDAMEEEGIARDVGIKQFYIVDIHGLIHTDLEQIDEEQKQYARPTAELAQWTVSDPSHITLLEVIQHTHAKVLIGVSTQTGAFTEEVVKTMAKKVHRPIILPLSNPTVKAEARPKDLIEWTQGRAIIATGSPFPPVEYQGKVFSIAQCNNACIFPGLGLGVIAVKARKMTRRMFVAAAKRLSEYSPILQDPSSSLFPSFENLRNISKEIAFVVARVAQEDGVADQISDEELRQRIGSNVWVPDYP